jgi:hypothetical protein
MRPLTDDEKELIILHGFKALMESLEVSQEDWDMLAGVKGVIAAYTSGNEENFIETIKHSPKARDLFEFIVAAYDAVNDMEEDQELCVVPCSPDGSPVDPVSDAVERMENGETLVLDDEMMNKVCEHLAENFVNYLFQSVNGKSSLKVN